MSLFTQILGKTCTYRPVQKLLLKDGFVTADEKRVSMGLKGKRVWGGGREEGDRDYNWKHDELVISMKLPLSKNMHTTNKHVGPLIAKNGKNIFHTHSTIFWRKYKVFSAHARDISNVKNIVPSGDIPIQNH